MLAAPIGYVYQHDPEKPRKVFIRKDTNVTGYNSARIYEDGIYMIEIQFDV